MSRGLISRAQWRDLLLSDLAERITVGLATSVTKYYSVSGVPIIRNLNIKKGAFDGSDMVYLNKDFARRHRTKAAYAGDILTVRTGANLGQTCVLPDEYDGCHTFTTLIITTNKKILSPDFLSLHMNSPLGEAEINRLQVGAGKSNLNTRHLESYRISLPPISEQVKIAAIMSSWDRATEQTELLIAAKRWRKQALMQQLLTGKRRFPRCNRKWREMRLRDVFEPVYRSVTPNVEAVLSISSRKGFERQEDKFSKVIAGKNLDNYVLLCKGEFAYNKGNSKTYPQGCVFRLDDYEEAAVPNVYFCFGIRDAAQADPEFYRQYFEAGLLNEGLRGLINTGVRNNGLLNVYEGNFYELCVMLPPIGEQRRISDLLSCCDREIGSLCQKLHALKEQKRGLMQQLLTGKVGVGSS